MTEPNFDARRFRTTVPFYARYRLPYPDALIARVAAFVGMRPGDAVMDLGCGPGLLAVPFARAGFAVTAIDPEPEMVAACEGAARAADVRVDVRQGSSFDLPAGPFQLVTMGRSFHWMDRAATLAALDGIVTADGALAFFADSHPITVENQWRNVLAETGERYGRAEAPHVRQRRDPKHRSQQSLLLDSAFGRLSGFSEFIRRQIGADDIVGLAFSQSVTAPDRLGDRAAAFEAELRGALAQIAPDGRFTEIAELTALVARRG